VVLTSPSNVAFEGNCGVRTLLLVLIIPISSKIIRLHAGWSFGIE